MSVDVAIQGDVAILTLNDPANRNALSRQLVVDFHAALADPRVRAARAIVLAGGDKAFCAGANINDLLHADWMHGGAPGSNPVELFETLERYPRPLLAAVTGAALGGGLELLLSCDLIVAASGAFFALPEIGHGVIPNTALARLAPIVGRRRALELILTRRRVTAEEALSLNLVNLVVPREDALAAAVGMAADIVAGAAPAAIAAVKESLRRHARTDWDEVREALSRLPAEQWQEGLGAFIERRKPDYTRFWTQS
jgi:enoyl-CoA hydratase/carnithine racemase